MVFETAVSACFGVASVPSRSLRRPQYKCDLCPPARFPLVERCVMGKRKMPGESRSIDVTGMAPTAISQAAEEVIDLAGDSPTTSGTVLIFIAPPES